MPGRLLALLDEPDPDFAIVTPSRPVSARPAASYDLHQQPSYGAHGDVPYCAYKRLNAAFCMATDAWPAVPG